MSPAKTVKVSIPSRHRPLPGPGSTPLRGTRSQGAGSGQMGSKAALHTKRYEAFPERLRRARVETGAYPRGGCRAPSRPQTWVSKWEVPGWAAGRTDRASILGSGFRGVTARGHRRRNPGLIPRPRVGPFLPKKRLSGSGPVGRNIQPKRLAWRPGNPAKTVKWAAVGSSSGEETCIIARFKCRIRRAASPHAAAHLRFKRCWRDALQSALQFVE